jgi:hypothetical protein
MKNLLKTLQKHLQIYIIYYREKDRPLGFIFFHHIKNKDKK